jgi:hypothetical protein
MCVRAYLLVPVEAVESVAVKSVNETGHTRLLPPTQEVKVEHVLASLRLIPVDQCARVACEELALHAVCVCVRMCGIGCLY